MKTLIVEDEVASALMMEKILSDNFPELELSKAENLKLAAEKFKEIQPEILLLDVNLPDGNSIDFLKEIYTRNTHSFKVVFITAFSKYAVEAFQFSALDFILKPFTPNQLISSIQKVLQRCKEDTYKLKLETLLYNQQEPQKRKIVLKTQEDIFVVDITDIIRAEAHNNYTTIYRASAESILVSQSLKKIEDQLLVSDFIRVHQSHLVNTNFISKFQKKTNNLILTSEEKIPVSVAKRADLLEYFSKF
ncbi:LytR/AlgR family response regulator transcription factor [Zunongwangia endophytica]|uniref:LytR/AlgR family response regulator transcription factor n=1 Tax=Zunongwangia endophytica TaxID=1808945 RepID=A0ABV8HA40_9FLAO|nr:LytTR family DNA-binding domain-containing protein [Zunongwangia endophytica]MDN3594701.1 LytTR family DNA-binding domain-containing protein [Zunongwangia endophytica]